MNEQEYYQQFAGDAQDDDLIYQLIESFKRLGYEDVDYDKAATMLKISNETWERIRQRMTTITRVYQPDNSWRVSWRFMK